MIESSYNEPLDHIPSIYIEDEKNADDHLYESLDEISGTSHGNISNILGQLGKLPPKAPTPLLKKRRPLSETSNLPNIQTQ